MQTPSQGGEPADRRGFGRGPALALALVAICGVAGDRGPPASPPELFPDLWRLGDAAAAAQRKGPAALVWDLLSRIEPGPARRAEALRRADGNPEPERGDRLLEAEQRLAEALRSLDPRERALLWSAALEPGLDEGTRARWLRMLDSGTPDPGALRQALAGGSGPVAWEAAVRLGQRGRQAGGLEALREAVGRWRGWGRQYPILGLRLLGDPAALPELRAAASDPSPAVRRHVGLALAELGERQDLGLLEGMIREDAEPTTRRVLLVARRRLWDRFPPLP